MFLTFLQLLAAFPSQKIKLLENKKLRLSMHEPQDLVILLASHLLTISLCPENNASSHCTKMAPFWHSNRSPPINSACAP